MSIVLERVFEMVLANTGAASVLILIVAVVLAVCGRRLKPAWRHALWLLVVVRLVAAELPESPASIFNARQWFERQRPVEVREVPQVHMAERASVVEADAVPVPVVPMAEPALRWSAVAAAAWAAVCILLLLRLPLAHLWMASRLKRAASAPSNFLRAELNELSSRIGVRAPDILVTSLVESPALFGVWKPVLLWPAAMEDSEDVGAMRQLLAHELAHVQRRDLAVNALMNAAAAVHWFNPLVWLAMRQARVEREVACDAKAIEISGTAPVQYGRTMLGLLEQAKRGPAPSLVLGVAEESFSARRRMKEIAAFGSVKASRGLAAAILVMLVCGGLTNAQDQGKKEARNTAVAQTSSDKRVTTSRNTVTLDVHAPSGSSKRERVSGRSEVSRLLESLSITNFQVPAGATLGETLTKLDEAARRADPEGRGLMFYVASHKAAGGADSAVFDRVDEYVVNLPQGDSPVRLRELVWKIAAVARPPAGVDATNRLACAAEEIGVVFTEARFQAEPLYTRTYRLNPNVISAALGAGDLPEIEEERQSVMTQRVREYFLKGGIEFGPPMVNPLQDAGPRKAIFFNDRTGVLFVRSTLRDLDVIETLLQAVNSAPPQVTFEAVLVTEPNDKLMRAMEMLFEARAHAGVLTEAQFVKLRAEFAYLGGGQKQLPKVTTLSKRPAILELEKVIAVQVQAEVEESVLGVHASASELSGPMRKSTAGAKIYDGQTLFLRMGPNAGLKQPSYVFITATVIDPAGNRVLDGDNPPFDRNTIPAQQ